jgi:hypothetical protein
MFEGVVSLQTLQDQDHQLGACARYARQHEDMLGSVRQATQFAEGRRDVALPL